jgi:L-fuculose-phosphate aldolase
MHLACYRARPDVGAIVHAHPPVATGFAAAGRGLPDDVLPELPVVVGPIALVPYGRPGTPALSEAMAPFMAEHQVFLLANHGVTVMGSSLEVALQRIESVEQGARIVLVAQLLGGAQRLDADEVRALRALHLLGAPSRDGGT